jgi:hypothetical protein
MKHKELTGKIIECAYQVYKKRLASFVYPACGSEADIPLIGAEAKRRFIRLWRIPLSGPN